MDPGRVNGRGSFKKGTVMAQTQSSGGETSQPAPGVDLGGGPDWWLSRPKEIRDFLESLEGVHVEEIGETAGGRKLIAAEWGEREDLPGRTSESLGSALSSGDASAFYGKGRRKRQGIMFIGAAHGTEFEGTVAVLNYLNIAVTGKDLTGRPQPKMAENACRYRWTIIPILNVDGRERAGEVRHWLGCKGEYGSGMTQGRWADGSVVAYGKSKAFWPLTKAPVKFLGSYYNDAGYNLVYDFPCGEECQPETRALIKYCRQEMPDLAILSHSNAGSLVFGPSTTLPPHYKQRVSILGGLAGMRCYRDGLAKCGFPMSPYTAGSIDGGGAFYQTDLVYQVSGALPLLIEFPSGHGGVPDSHLGILDIGLAGIDELCAFGGRYPFRPLEKNEV
jgi:hypothetical protein